MLLGGLGRRAVLLQRSGSSRLKKGCWIDRYDELELVTGHSMETKSQGQIKSEARH